MEDYTADLVQGDWLSASRRPRDGCLSSYLAPLLPPPSACGLLHTLETSHLRTPLQCSVAMHPQRLASSLERPPKEAAEAFVTPAAHGNFGGRRWDPDCARFDKSSSASGCWLHAALAAFAQLRCN